MVRPHLRHAFTRWQGLLLLHPLLFSGLGIQFEMAPCQIQTRAPVPCIVFFRLKELMWAEYKTTHKIGGFPLESHCNRQEQLTEAHLNINRYDAL